MLRQGLVLFGLLTLVTGLVYPLAVTGLAGLCLPRPAGGSLLTRQGKVVGSELLAQKFTGDQYFQPRPSAGDFATVPSAASNLGPTSRALRDAVATRAQALRQADRLAPDQPLPADLLTTSGSGLDPHISPEGVTLQIERVARVRGFTAEQRGRLEGLVRAMTEPPQWGILGEPRVNVLRLNLAVDGL